MYLFKYRNHGAWKVRSDRVRFQKKFRKSVDVYAVAESDETSDR